MSAAGLFFSRFKSGDQGTVVGSHSPIGQRKDIGFFGVPFASHSGTEQEVVQAAVGVLNGVVMGPGNVSGHVAAIWVGCGVLAIFFHRAGIKKLGFALADNVFRRGSTLRIIEIAKHYEIY